MAVSAIIPSFDERLAEIAAAEQAEGWLIACEDSGRFLAPCRELMVSLAHVLKELGADPVLEICAGRGELAEALAAENLPIVATDSKPQRGRESFSASVKDHSKGAPNCPIRKKTPDPVEQATADEALRRYQPQVVLGSFVPVDAGVDEAVLSFSSVEHYIVLGARLGGTFGSPALWRQPGWQAKPLETVARWMLTRHDVWLGLPHEPILRHGEAWLLSRRGTNV